MGVEGPAECKRIVVPVAIVGAGPYGLSLAANLSAAHTGFRIFGTPMAFWSAIATAGQERYLKSFCFGTNIDVSEPGYGFSEWSRARGLEWFEPCSIQQFVDYGLWVQKRCVPSLEQQNVAAIRREGSNFHLTLQDGETLLARRVVLATGLSGFDYLPKPFAALPSALCTHTVKVTGYTGFAGQSVAVIGSGQSALEAAALLAEAGANPTLIVRDDEISWMTALPRERSLWRRIRSPLSGLAAGPRAWFLTNVPGAVHCLPDRLRTRIVAKQLPPEGAWWLRDRVEGKVETLTATSVADAREDAGACVLSLSANGHRLDAPFRPRHRRNRVQGRCRPAGASRSRSSASDSAHHGIASAQSLFRDHCRATARHRPCICLEFRAAVPLCRWCAVHGSNPDPPFRGASLMKPILFFFPGAGPPGDVAETLGRLFPEVEVVGIAYPEWRNLTDPERAMDHLLHGVERQVRAKAGNRPVLIVGYSLGRRSAGALPTVSSGRGGVSRFLVRSTGGLSPRTNPKDNGCGRLFATSRAIFCAATSVPRARSSARASTGSCSARPATTCRRWRAAGRDAAVCRGFCPAIRFSKPSSTCAC